MDIVMDYLNHKYYYENMKDIQGFFIIDADINLTQYFYDKDYTNKIYYIKQIKSKNTFKREIDKYIILKGKMILFSNNSNYYTLDNTNH
jgi:hypothetical protein